MDENAVAPRIGWVDPKRPRTCEICAGQISGTAIWWRNDEGRWLTVHPEDKPECSDRMLLVELLRRVG